MKSNSWTAFWMFTMSALIAIVQFAVVALHIGEVERTCAIALVAVVVSVVAFTDPKKEFLLGLLALSTFGGLLIGLLFKLTGNPFGDPALVNLGWLRGYSLGFLVFFIIALVWMAVVLFLCFGVAMSYLKVMTLLFGGSGDAWIAVFFGHLLVVAWVVSRGGLWVGVVWTSATLVLWALLWLVERHTAKRSLAAPSAT